MNYKVNYIGLAEGYDIEETTDDVDNYEIFGSFKEAKRKAVANAENDIELVENALANTVMLKLRNVTKLSDFRRRGK